MKRVLSDSSVETSCQFHVIGRDRERERTCHPIHGDIGYVEEVTEHVTSE